MTDYKIIPSDKNKIGYKIKDMEKDQHTDLIFHGKGASNYGEDLWNNFYHLLENFCNGGPESGRALEGQLWYNNVDHVLKVYKQDLGKKVQSDAAKEATGKLKSDLDAIKQKLDAIKNSAPLGKLEISGDPYIGKTITLSDTISDPNGKMNNPILTWYLA